MYAASLVIIAIIVGAGLLSNPIVGAMLLISAMLAIVCTYGKRVH